MGKEVTGINCVVLIDDAGTDKLIACARTISISYATAFIETSVSGSGAWETVLPAKKSFTATLDGVVNIDHPTLLSLPFLRALQFNDTPLSIKFQRTNGDGDLYTEQVTAYIASSSDAGNFNDMNLFTIELRGSGAPTIL